MRTSPKRITFNSNVTKGEFQSLISPDEVWDGESGSEASQE